MYDKLIGPSNYSATLGETEADYIERGSTKGKQNGAKGKEEDSMHAMYAVAQNEKEWNRRKNRNGRKNWDRGTDYIREKPVKKPRRKRINPHDFDEWQE